MSKELNFRSVPPSALPSYYKVLYLLSDTEDNASILKEEVKGLGYSGSMQEIMINIFMDIV